MTNLFDDDNGTFVVLVNHDCQYSLWPEILEAPRGWSIVGPRGARSDCLAWIDANWTDMRPKSLIDQLLRSEVEP